jgi:hypothetical protein
MAKYLLLEHYRGPPASINDVPIDREGRNLHDARGASLGHRSVSLTVCAHSAPIISVTAAILRNCDVSAFLLCNVSVPTR